MNDEYLWDKSGDPDPEIQQLEEVLGSLKYQPRPLGMPRGLVVVRRRPYMSHLAIAASLILALLAAGFWLLRVQNQNPPKADQARVEQPSPEPTKTIQQQNGKPEVEKKDAVVAVNRRPRRKYINVKPTTHQRQEALAAKEQLMLALRLASEKLNLAQKKTLSPSAPTQIRNQHKVG